MLESLGTQREKDGLLDKYIGPETNAVCTEEWSCVTKKVLELLPYALTSSQLQAVSEIIWDLKRPVPMNRLLQVLILSILILLYYYRNYILFHPLLIASCFMYLLTIENVMIVLIVLVVSFIL